MKLSGTVWKYGDNVNTDVIFPGKYTYTLTDRNEIASHALEDLDPTFVRKVQPGDIVVAGRNWGCGSSREQAATCLVYNGVKVMIAESYSRIFYRNAINCGLLAIVCPAAVQAIVAGETVTVNLDEHQITCGAGVYLFPPFSASILGIIEAGGLVDYVKHKMSGEDATQTGGVIKQEVLAS